MKIKVVKRNRAFISYEDMGDFVYLHEFKNKQKGLDGIRLVTRFIRMVKKPIVCSTLKDGIARASKRYGFDIYKRIGDRIFMIRKER